MAQHRMGAVVVGIKGTNRKEHRGMQDVGAAVAKSGVWPRDWRRRCVIEECSPLSTSSEEGDLTCSTTEGRRTLQDEGERTPPLPTWADGLSPVTSDNYLSETNESLLGRATAPASLQQHMHYSPKAPSWSAASTQAVPTPHGTREEEEDLSALHWVSNRPVPAKLIYKEKEHMLQIQVCWACRLDLCESLRPEDQTARETDAPLLKLPHFAVGSWRDVASSIRKDNGVQSSQMVFWLRQSLFPCINPFADEDLFDASYFDLLCSSSAGDYARATDVPVKLTYFIGGSEELCLRCRRPSLLPILVNEDIETRHLVQEALRFKEALMQARRLEEERKLDVSRTERRQVTDSPHTKVVSLYAAMNEAWRQEPSSRYNTFVFYRWNTERGDFPSPRQPFHRRRDTTRNKNRRSRRYIDAQSQSTATTTVAVTTATPSADNSYNIQPQRRRPVNRLRSTAGSNNGGCNGVQSLEFGSTAAF